MNSPFLASAGRFLLLFALQVLVLKPISLQGGQWLNAFVYPLAIIFLPVTMPVPLACLAAFGLGLGVDLFYSSPGVHAGAAVLTAFSRSILLVAMQPRQGFAGSQIPSPRHFGMTWFMRFAAILMGIHLLAYFSFDAFTLVYIVQILGKTISSFILSMMFVFIYVQLFDPKN